MKKDCKVIKKDGTKEDFNVQKVIVAVNKSAYRALIKFTDEELKFICQFVEEKVDSMGDFMIAPYFCYSHSYSS